MNRTFTRNITNSRTVILSEASAGRAQSFASVILSEASAGFADAESKDPCASNLATNADRLSDNVFPPERTTRA